MRCVVTGGAGFIGSHLVDKLLSLGHEVISIDDLSSGKKANVDPKVRFIKKDARSDLSAELKGADVVFHLAADPDVRSNSRDPKKSFDINVNGTKSVLESCRKAGVKRFVYTSTSAVYGEAKTIPTPEDSPCAPISEYGRSKLEAERLVKSFSERFGTKCTILRLANIYGERSERGVMHDLFEKLQNDPKSLEILGDGKQDKSYLYVSDCVSGIIAAWAGQQARYEVYNIGSKEKFNVERIARHICDGLALKPKFRFTGTKKGWVGDVPLMLLSTKKIEALGWRQKVQFEEGMDRYLGYLEKQI